MRALRDIAREEAGHAVAAEVLGRRVERVQVGFSSRTSLCALEPHAPARTADRALRDCVVRLVGPILADGAAVEFPPFPGLPLDDRTAATLIADCVSPSIEASDALLAAAERAAEALAADENYRTAVSAVADTLIRAGGELLGDALRDRLVQLPRISTGCDSFARAEMRPLEGGRARFARRRGAASVHSTSAAEHGPRGSTA